jgi:hypothetical protein
MKTTKITDMSIINTKNFLNFNRKHFYSNFSKPNMFLIHYNTPYNKTSLNKPINLNRPIFGSNIYVCMCQKSQLKYKISFQESIINIPYAILFSGYATNLDSYVEEIQYVDISPNMPDTKNIEEFKQTLNNTAKAISKAGKQMSSVIMHSMKNTAKILSMLRKNDQDANS